MSVAIKIENVSKLYRLGTVGTGTISHDLNRWWHTIRGKEDPYAKVGQINDRTKATSSEERETSSDSATPSRRSSLATSDSYVWALRDINLEVQQGEILGIIGRNGAGKSTLLKLLSRITAPTTGAIKTKGRIASLLEVGTGFHPELTGRENIYVNGAILGMQRHEITRQLDEIVEFSGCAKYLDTPTKRYSSGMTVRLGFAVAAHLNPEILIIDEVLAVGDSEFQARCVSKMQDVARTGKTILFVSHNIASIRALTTRGILLTNGQVVFDGPTPECVDAYAHLNVPTPADAIEFADRPNWVTGEMKLTQISFGEDSQGNERGLPKSIKLSFTSNVTEKSPVICMTIFSRTGTPIASGFFFIESTVNSGDLTTLKIQLDQLELIPGEYFFSLALSSKRTMGKEASDALLSVLPFSVKERSLHSLNWSTDWGYVNMGGVVSDIVRLPVGSCENDNLAEQHD